MLRHSGIVIHGDGFGRTLGYPTANISYDREVTGIFAGTVIIDDIEHHAAIFISERRPILEVHVLDFDGDLYGKQLDVSFEKKIREDARFDDMEAMKAVIRADIGAVRAYFKAVN